MPIGFSNRRHWTQHVCYIDLHSNALHTINNISFHGMRSSTLEFVEEMKQPIICILISMKFIISLQTCELLKPTLLWFHPPVKFHSRLFFSNGIEQCVRLDTLGFFCAFLTFRCYHPWRFECWNSPHRIHLTINNFNLWINTKNSEKMNLILP